jgi:hypothetical protein
MARYNLIVARLASSLAVTAPLAVHGAFTAWSWHILIPQLANANRGLRPFFEARARTNWLHFDLLLLILIAVPVFLLTGALFQHLRSWRPARRFLCGGCKCWLTRTASTLDSLGIPFCERCCDTRSIVWQPFESWCLRPVPFWLQGRKPAQPASENREFLPYFGSGTRFPEFPDTALMLMVGMAVMFTIPALALWCLWLTRFL